MEIKWKKQKQKRKEREERGIGGPRGKKSSIYFVSVFIFFFCLGFTLLFFSLFPCIDIYIFSFFINQYKDSVSEGWVRH